MQRGPGLLLPLFTNLLEGDVLESPRSAGPTSVSFLVDLTR
jgi:hypothetical protein